MILPPLHLSAALSEFLFSTYYLHSHLISREQERPRFQENRRQPKSQSTYPPTSRLYSDPWGAPDVYPGGHAIPVQQLGYWTPQYLPPSARQAPPQSLVAPMQSVPPNSTKSTNHHVSFDPTVTMYSTHDHARTPDSHSRGTPSSRPGPVYYYDSLQPPAPYAGKRHSSAKHRSQSPHTPGPVIPPLPTYVTPPPIHYFQDTAPRPILKRPLDRPASGSASDRYAFAISKWAKGDDCKYRLAHHGTVLMRLCASDRPALGLLEIRRLELEFLFNPLLQPLSTAPGSTTIIWNMIFPGTHACSPSDPGGESWLEDRLGPALFPSLSQIRIISRSFPWTIEVESEHPRKALTCKDITDQIHRFLCALLDPLEMIGVTPDRKRAMSAAYRVNRSQDIPAAVFKDSAGMRRIDWLCKDTIFGGLMEDRQYVAERLSEYTPGTFVLNLEKRSGMRGLVSLRKTGVQPVQGESQIVVGDQTNVSSAANMAALMPAASPQPNPSHNNEITASA